MPRYRTIREIREAAGLTQVELGERCGVTGQTVYRWERGDMEPTATALRKIARACEVSMDVIDLRPFEKTKRTPLAGS